MIEREVVEEKTNDWCIKKMMSIKEAVEELKKSERIFITIKEWGYDWEYHYHYPFLMIWVENENRIYPIYCDSVYYNDRREAYEVKVFGVDRSLELISSIAGYENCFEGLGLMKKTVALI